MSRAPFVFLLALSACQPSDRSSSDSASEAAMETSPAETAAERPSPSPNEANEPTGSPGQADRVTNSERLTGEYRVAGVDGQDINLPFGITASISQHRIEVASDCVRMAWSYRFEGQALATEPVPIVSCDRGRYPEEVAIENAFDVATAVRLNPSNGYEFTGEGRSVTLFTQ